MTTADAVLRDLLERGLVSAKGAVDGDALIVSAAQRGWFRVFEKERVQLFVRSRGAGYARERALLDAGVLPPLKVHDDTRELLVFETFPGGYDVVEFHRMHRRVAEWLPALIGNMLAAVHVTPVAREAFPRDVPAQLRPQPGTMPAVAQAMSRVAAAWTGDALLHGDAGFDRIIVAPEPQRRIHLVDWDEARIGDPAWDVGAVLEWYYAWSLEPRIVKDVEGPVCPLPPQVMQAAIASFWSTYVTTARLAAPDARTRLERAFGYAGARMLARIERMMRKPDDVGPQLTQLMQAAIALMTSPPAAVNAFFAPPPPAWPPRQSWGAW